MRWEPWKSEAKNRRVSLSAALAGVFLRNRDIRAGPLPVAGALDCAGTRDLGYPTPTATGKVLPVFCSVWVPGSALDARHRRVVERIEEDFGRHARRGDLELVAAGQ